LYRRGVHLDRHQSVSGDESTLPDGLIDSVERDDDINGESVVNLAQSDGVSLDQDFGYEEAPTGPIGDTIFLDSNGNGSPGMGEGIEGVEVTLTDQDGKITTTTTDADGQCLFEDLDPTGIYLVTVASRRRREHCGSGWRHGQCSHCESFVER